MTNVNTAPSLDDKTLGKARWKFGLSMVLVQSEDAGLGGLPTVIVRMLGGNEFHLGVVGCTRAIFALFQWLGAVLLNFFGSYRKAMMATVFAGAVSSMAIAGAILFSNALTPIIGLWSFMLLFLVLTAVLGIQWNIDPAWIGEIVPVDKLGWFTSVKWIFATFGIVISALLIGKFSDTFPTARGYAAIFTFMAVSFIISSLLYNRIPDAKPKIASYFGGDNGERLDYKNSVFRKYVLFYVLFALGGSIWAIFLNAYLIDRYHFTLTNIALLNTLQLGLSTIWLHVFGKLSDRKGRFFALVVLMCIICTAMFGWVITAFFGFWFLIVLQLPMSFWGHCFSMTAINYGLEVLPEKGRAAYFGVTQIAIGIATLPVMLLTGKVMLVFHDFQFVWLGATFCHYHVCFLAAALVRLASLLPVYLIHRETHK